MGRPTASLFFACDYVAGVNSEQLLQKPGARPAACAIQITCQMLEALAFVHDKGFVHRNLKPSNVLVDTSGTKDVVCAHRLRPGACLSRVGHERLDAGRRQERRPGAFSVSPSQLDPWCNTSRRNKSTIERRRFGRNTASCFAGTALISMSATFGIEKPGGSETRFQRWCFFVP